MATQNEELSRRVLEEVWSRGNLEPCEELFASDFIDHDASLPVGLPPGPEGVKAIVTQFRAAFPDLQVRVDEQIASGDRVATRWTATGTQRGALFGYPATGKSATVSGVTIDRFAGGKIAEAWASWDSLSMFRQLGLMAPPEARP